MNIFVGSKLAKKSLTTSLECCIQEAYLKTKSDIHHWTKFLPDFISGRYHGVFKGGVRYQSGLTAAGEKNPS